MTAPGDAAAAPGRARRTRAVLVAAVVVALLAGGIGAWWIASRGSDPRDTAERYLTALVRGDAEALDAVTDADDDALALFARARAHVSDAALGAVETDGDRAELHAEVTLDGEPREVAVPMARAGDTWIVRATTALTVTPSRGDAFAIGDRAFAADDTPILLPGAYEVTALPGDILDGAARVAILPGQESADVELDATVADGATEIVQERLEGHAERCAAATDAVPAACGIVVPWAADLRELERIAFTIERLPRASLDADAGTFQATGGALVAEASGVAHDGSAQSFTYRTDDWTMRGTLTFRDAQLILSVF
ncbi:hypothetical protein ACWDR7_03670 [Microbacterium sp. NPDC003461]